MKVKWPWCRQVQKRGTPVILRNDGEGLVQMIISEAGQVLHSLHDGSRVDLFVFDGLGSRTLRDREEVRQAHCGIDHIERVMSTFGRPRLHRKGRRLHRRWRRRRGYNSRHRTTNVHVISCLRTNLPRRLEHGRTRYLLHLTPLRIAILDSKQTNLGKTDLFVTRQTV